MKSPVNPQNIDTSKTIRLQILQDQFKNMEKPLRLFLKGDIVNVELVEKIKPNMIYYLVQKDTQNHLFFCTISESIDRYIIEVDNDKVEVMREDLFNILDVYQFSSFERFI